MNNPDLISREALLKELDEYNEFAVFDCEAVKDLINSAPAVEPKLKDDVIEAFNLITDQEFEHSDSFWVVTPKGKKIEFEKKRPHGKWILEGMFYHCSCCGQDLDQVPENFCAYCGAFMGDDVNETDN